MVPAQPALEEPRPLSWMRDYGSRGALILHRMFQKAPVAKRPHLLELSMRAIQVEGRACAKAIDGPPAPTHGVTAESVDTSPEFK